MPSSATETVNNHTSDNPSLPRSASFTYLPAVAPAESSSPGLRRTFSDLSIPRHADPPTKESVDVGKDILRRTSQRSKDRPAIGVSKFSISTEDLVNTGSAEPRNDAVPVPETKPPEPAARPAKGRSVSGRLVSLARKPWSSNYRSQPPPVRAEGPQAQPTKTPSPSNATSESVADTAAESKKRTVFYRRPRLPTLAVVTDGGDNPGTPTSPAPSLRTKSSFSKLTSSPNISTPLLPPMPKIASVAAAVTGSSTPESPRKKDELWGVFRSLDADYQKFQSKSSALKANVIRSSLLSFLNNHHQASCGDVRPEDLDRRVAILNKWWTGLLEMLNGKNNQSISGTDRPAYLDAVVGIMNRPEWRVPFPAWQSNSCVPDPQEGSTSISDSSDASSSGTEFLVASIYHNIRNIFVQNLLSQMAFVVGRMSMRNAPASLVAFCGKACAYAFFFCPGVADILTRLWNTPADVLRRVLEESGVYRNANVRSFTQDLSLNFPVGLRTLSVQSYASFVRYLRRSPDVPLSATKIPWQSPWISRWCGRDTDLFFVFVKYIHLLYADCLPPRLEKSKRIFAPGLLPIHGHLLVILEDTLYKQSMPQVPDNSHVAAAVTFDDFIEGADASVSALPLGAPNGQRSMAENRLVVLLRDFLSASSPEPDSARSLYAESFCTTMKAAARRTSLFDHSACFMLCDFLEEVIPIFVRYSQTSKLELVDWNFWLEACRKMVQSHNSLTEIRVFSFLFCIWNTWVAAEERKAELCLGFLLHESLLYSYFSHWSPMVRAYFQRLLCWRVARFNDDPTPLDSKIYETLSDRLQQIFGYYVAFQSKAEEELTAPQSSAPCTPAPGRRIIIIRCDNQPSPAPSLFDSFDRLVPRVPPDQIVASKNQGFSKPESHASESQPTPKRRWNLLKSVFGVSANSKQSDHRTPGNGSDEPNTDGLKGTPSEKTSQGHDGSKNSSNESLRLKSSQSFSFRFSLEWMDRPQWPSKNKRLFNPCLPSATQAYIEHRQATTGLDGYESTSEYGSDGNSEKSTKSSGDSQEKSDTDGTVQAKTRDLVSMPEKEVRRQSPETVTISKFAASKYAGRALAEWAQVVSECDSFFSRRRDEGVPSDELVETPMLGVESFRK